MAARDELWTPPAVPPAAGSVRLRGFRDGDVPAAMALSLDPYVPLIGTLPPRASASQALEWVAAQRQRTAQRVGFSFAVADRDDDDCVGFAGLWLRQVEHGLATAGYAVLPASRGAGRATDALRALTAFAWTRPGVERVELHVEPWNLASRRVAERAGYTAGELMVRAYEIGGELRDVVPYLLVRPRWVRAVPAAELDRADAELVAAARRAVEAHGDGELHTVAAAVRDEHGRVHVGLNLHHFTGGPCAELVALAVARGAGARRPVAIVAVGDRGRGVLAPCGRDRQVLLDQHPGIRVLVPTPEGPRGVPVAELLPHAFSAAAQQVQRLRFDPRYLAAVQDGSKRVTMRFRDPVAVGPALLVFEFPHEVVLPGRVTATVHTTVAEVGEEEARAVGFTGREQVLPGLRHHYPDLTEDDEIVLVSFDVGP